MRRGERSRILSAMLLVVACATLATPSPAQTAPPASESGGTKPVPPPATSPQPACASVWDFIATNCPLTWYGITLYGTVDMGASWQSHGTPFNGKSVTGLEYLLSKNSNRAQWERAPNALSQSAIGIRGNEEFTPGWAVVFTLEAGFNPYSLRLANGPGAMHDNAGVPLDQQSTSADSSRAGQFYNSQGYLGVSSPTYGTLTVFRQNALTLDGVVAYDPMGGSYAFSPIGYQGIACGGGNTENCRHSTSLKYRVNIAPFRAAALLQFGGYDMNNASEGAYQFQVGGDIHDVAGGSVSLDGIYSFVRNSVALSLAGNTLPAVLPQIFTATLSDNEAWMALARYTNGPIKLFGGYEWIDYKPPSDPQVAFTDIAGHEHCAGCASFNNTNINNTAFNADQKILHIFWAGAKYAITDSWSVTGAYYRYIQENFGPGPSCDTAALPTCRGTYQAISFVVDWQFAAKFDAYAGLMYQEAAGGLANGFLHRNTIDPTIGFRFRF